MNTMKSIPVEKFGRDHWSLLAYVEHCCVNGRDGVGEIDHRRMRCNPNGVHSVFAGVFSANIPWKPNYGSRLFGYFELEGHGDPEVAIAAGLQLRDHDDWNCLEDLEAAGYVEARSLVNGFVKMTEKGSGVAGKLRAHKAAGGQFAGFRLDDVTYPESMGRREQG